MDGAISSTRQSTSYSLPAGEARTLRGEGKKEEVKKRMTLSETQTLGFSSTVQKTFLEEGAALRTAGYDPDAMQRNLKRLHDEVVALGADQEDLKRQLKDKTKQLNDGLKRLYNLTSGGVDALMTAVEKSSPAAKNIRRLRSRIRRSDYVESPAVQPVPMKTE
jgi:hypothetical protein